MFFPVNIFLADGTVHAFVGKYWRKANKKKSLRKRSARNRKKQGNFQVLWGGMMSSCVGASRWKCERKILAGKKYEKCNKFYYYDVSTSLVCIKGDFSSLLARACGAGKKVNAEVNCLIKWGDLNLFCRFKLHLFLHNPTSADDKSWELSQWRQPALLNFSSINLFDTNYRRECVEPYDNRLKWKQLYNV